MSEATFRAGLVKAFREAGVFVRSVEARETPDFPDIYLRDPLTRESYWLELKDVAAIPGAWSHARPLLGRLRVGQARWLNGHWEAGGASFVLARFGHKTPRASTVLLIPGKCGPALPRATFDDMVRVASVFRPEELNPRVLIDTMKWQRKSL